MIQYQHIIKEKPWIFIIVLLCPILFVIIGCFVFPSIFYDQFIWKYFWGPIVSDALEKPVSFNGVKAAQKFTLVSEIIYGILVVGVLYGLLNLFTKWNIKMDRSFFTSLIPYIIYGSVVRVLEDSAFFSEPFVYWFVTPLVYFQILFFFLFFLIVGRIFTKKTNNSYLSQLNIVSIGGIILLLPFLYYTGLWIIGEQWSYSNGVRFDVFILVIFLLMIIITGIYSLGRYFKNIPGLYIYTGVLNLSMIFGHMLDGITSWISIYDPFNMNLPGYIEKHPASDYLMQLWPPLFPIVKFILIVFVIYLFDVLYKKELEEYPRLVPLLKISIFILGFAPGLRDLLRVTMGV
jgi:uncharacterized membrane protein